MTPYFNDESVTLWHGDALEVLRTIPDQSVDCCVTSPPYFGLRDYGSDGQYGLEASPAEYVEHMRAVFAEAFRVLSDDGTLWLNLGDTYAARQRGSDAGWDKSRLNNPGRVQKAQFASLREGRHTAFDRPYKNLLGMPWRVAFALQDAGWILRNDIIWHKSNCMPESVTDRVAGRHEYVFMFSKSGRYQFDLSAIREAHSAATLDRAQPHRAAPGKSRREGLGLPPGAPSHSARLDQINHPDGRNPGDVWTLPTQPFAEAHFAVMPTALAERAIQAGCKPGGVVLDPFSGSGTTGLAAARHGRRYVGIDLSSNYLDLSLRTRLALHAEDWLVLLESVTDHLGCDYESCARPGAGVVIWKQRHDCGCGQAEIVCASHANEIVMALTFNLGLRCGRTQQPVGRARDWIRDVEPL